MSGNELEVPDFYQFPPFFTLQPVQETRDKQLKLWLQWLSHFLRHERRFVLNAGARDDACWRNARIDRALTLDEARQVIDYLVQEGHARWRGGADDRREATASWRPFSAWGDALFAWADECGRLGEMMTAAELCDSDDVRGQEWRGCPPELVVAAAEALVPSGRATVLSDGDSPSETGIKFHHP